MDWTELSIFSVIHKDLWLTNVRKIIIDLYFNEIGKQAEKSIKKLKDYARYYSDDIDIQALYAKGLAIMILKSEKNEAKEYFQTLRDFCLRFPEDLNIQEAYVLGLNNCFPLFAREMINRYFEEYQTIRAGFPDNENIPMYCDIAHSCEDFECENKRLENKFDNAKRQFEGKPNHTNAAFLSEDFQNLVGKSNPLPSCLFLIEWSRFIENYPDYELLHTAFTKALASNIGSIDVVRAEELLLRLKISMNTFTDNMEIVINYATCLRALLINQIAFKSRGLLEELRILTERFPDNQKIAIEYIRSLTRYIWGLGKYLQVLMGVEEKELSLVLSNYLIKYNYREDLVTEYSRCLMSCVGRHEQILAEKALLMLKQLVVQFPENDSVIRSYAVGLNYYTHEQDKAGAEKTEKEYRKLVSDYPNNLSIQKHHANRLKMSIGRESLEKATVILDEFITLVERYPEEKWIQRAYVSGMSSFIYRNKAGHEEIVMSTIEKHAKQLIGNVEIQEIYTNLLISL